MSKGGQYNRAVKKASFRVIGKLAVSGITVAVTEDNHWSSSVEPLNENISEMLAGALNEELLAIEQKSERKLEKIKFQKCLRIDVNSHGLACEIKPVSRRPAKKPSQALVGRQKISRPGLELRSQKMFLRMGQLKDSEYRGLKNLAKKFGKDIVLSGSLAETAEGFRQRYHGDDLSILGFREEKIHSDLVVHGESDIDIWEGSNLSSSELKEVSKCLNNWEVDATGYSVERYPTLNDFGTMDGGPGALVFRKNGSVERILGAWQR